MRKDVRLGFAVGGVLLAVIIVAVLVFHRNHGKQVVFDAGKSQAATGSTDPGSVDVGTPSPSNDSPAKNPESAPQNPPANAEAAVPPKQDDSAPPAVAPKTSDKWDALFATTGDPVKAQLTSPADEHPHHSRHQPLVQADPPLRSPGGGQANNAPTDSGSSTPDISVPQRVTREPAPVTSDMTTSHGRTHRVEAGETFVSIARAAYGDGRYYLAIQNANPSVNANRLKPGTILHLPPESEVKQASHKRSSESTVSRASSNRDSTTYVVRKGDNLYLIAHKLGKSQDELYGLNRQTIGPDSTKLKIGMVLKVPSSSASNQ